MSTPGGSAADRPEREIVFQSNLCYVLRDLIREHPDFNSFRFEKAELEFPAGVGRADIALLLSGGRPFVVIETKRKVGDRVVARDIDPWNPHVIKQALGYAVDAGAPYFATANRGYLAAFRTPERREKFEIPTHRVFATAIKTLDTRFAAEFVQRLVDYDLASSAADRAQIATALDWTFVYRLRSFVDWLTARVEPVVVRMFSGSPEFLDRVKKFEKERGTKIGPHRLAREMVYVLANKILFHKALERRYKDLPKLSLEGASDAEAIRLRLAEAFKDATVVTHDFEAIFSAALYDDIPFEADPADLAPLAEGIQGFVEDMETYRLEELESDVIGHVYERLIPEEERHELGQFYTPPVVAELIVKWAVRESDDTIFDPAAGSGTFLVKAYQRLKTLKEEQGVRFSRSDLHRSILSQIFSNDIDAFAVHLTAMNLALRDVRDPVTEVNIFESDFFHLVPATGQVVQKNGVTGKVPLVSVVVGNPPYTRWTELPESTKLAIKKHLDPTLKGYGLVARVRGGVETAVYQHFVIHGASFLREGGRLGMIISNSWLQTDVGVQFGKFLLDNFRIRGVLDFGPRFFEIPLVATTVILLERATSPEDRASNRAIFAYFDDRVSVDDLLGIVNRPGDFASRAQVHTVEQAELASVGKWIGVFFGFERLDTKLRSRTVAVKDLFDVTKGTIRYCAEEKRGLGANEFFYLTEQGVKFRGLRAVAYPTLPNARALPYYTFDSDDWRALRKKDQSVYFFNCSRPRSDLPKEVREYITWGESECRNRDGVICARSQACSERARKRGYVGWYDGGGVQPASIISLYYGQYRRRFVRTKVKLALDHDFIAFRERERLTELQRKAVLASLNSTLGQLYVDNLGRTTGGGLVSMEAKHAEELRVVPVLDLETVQVKKLATAFDNLERATRNSGGAEDREAEVTLKSYYEDLDSVVGNALGLTAREMTEIQKLWKAMKDRRVLRASGASPESMVGEDAVRNGLSPPARRQRKGLPMARSRSLDEFGS